MLSTTTHCGSVVDSDAVNDQSTSIGNVPAVAGGPGCATPAPTRAAWGIALTVERGGIPGIQGALRFIQSQTCYIHIGRRPSNIVDEGEENGVDTALFRCQVMSRRHAKIVMTDEGNAYVVDLASHHGTYVVRHPNIAQERIDPEVPKQLFDGDLIVFGKTVGRGTPNVVEPVVVRVQFTHDQSKLASHRGAAPSAPPRDIAPAAAGVRSWRFGVNLHKRAISRDSGSMSDMSSSSSSRSPSPRRSDSPSDMEAPAPAPASPPVPESVPGNGVEAIAERVASAPSSSAWIHQPTPSYPHGEGQEVAYAISSTDSELPCRRLGISNNLTPTLLKSTHAASQLRINSIPGLLRLPSIRALLPIGEDVREGSPLCVPPVSSLFVPSSPSMVSPDNREEDEGAVPGLPLPVPDSPAVVEPLVEDSIFLPGFAWPELGRPDSPTPWRASARESVTVSLPGGLSSAPGYTNLGLDALWSSTARVPQRNPWSGNVGAAQAESAGSPSAELAPVSAPVPILDEPRQVTSTLETHGEGDAALSDVLEKEFMQPDREMPSPEEQEEQEDEVVEWSPVALLSSPTAPRDHRESSPDVTMVGEDSTATVKAALAQIQDSLRSLRTARGRQRASLSALAGSTDTRFDELKKRVESLERQCVTYDLALAGIDVDEGDDDVQTRLESVRWDVSDQAQDVRTLRARIEKFEIELKADKVNRDKERTQAKDHELAEASNFEARIQRMEESQDIQKMGEEMRTFRSDMEKQITEALEILQKAKLDIAHLTAAADDDANATDVNGGGEHVEVRSFHPPSYLCALLDGRRCMVRQTPRSEQPSNVLPPRLSLKRKRSISDVDDGNSADLPVRHGFAFAPGEREEFEEAMLLFRASKRSKTSRRIRRFASGVVHTVAAAAVGAVATWTVLAFS